MERTVTVVPSDGLHARPAATLTSTASGYEADVTIARAEDGEFVPANSMLAVTGLNIRHGEDVTLRVEGPDEATAVDTLEEILTTPVDDADETNADPNDDD
ncbi:HPr family phosphocarrier protein [Halosolutus amylolyticus]|uniref:HPr family phosphocarrier protein n=1 Tax=Halosolutus amylolyticus TaxID=2932267 RepID=A0ABD5PRE9_9EURY